MPRFELRFRTIRTGYAAYMGRPPLAHAALAARAAAWGTGIAGSPVVVSSVVTLQAVNPPPSARSQPRDGSTGRPQAAACAMLA